MRLLTIDSSAIIAREFKAELISFDTEMMAKVAVLERNKAK